VSRNYIGFELNGGIRSLRSGFCTERYSDARYLNAEFSHTLGWRVGKRCAALDVGPRCHRDCMKKQSLVIYHLTFLILSLTPASMTTWCWQRPNWEFQ